MKKVKSFEGFINESKVNLHDDWRIDTDKVVKALTTDSDIEHVDDNYMEITTPFEIHPTSEVKNKLGLSVFYSLLSYSYNYHDEKSEETLMPWVAIKFGFELNSDIKFNKELAEYLKDKIESATKLKLFKDEDATFGYWSEKTSHGFVSYTCYVNPDVPEGWWENHTL